MQKLSAHWSIAGVCLILGIMLSVQFQATRHFNAIFLPERTEDLTGQINTIAREKSALEQKAASLTRQIKNSRDYNQALADLQKELENANLAVGFTPVEGPGIIIIVDDNPAYNPEDDPNIYLIHDQALMQLANDLMAAGAEAISINGQRIVAMSEFRCAGTLININGVKTGAPFTLKVIGNPDILYGMMKSNQGYLAYLDMRGYKTSIEKADQLRLPALERPKSLLNII